MVQHNSNDHAFHRVYTIELTHRPSLFLSRSHAHVFFTYSLTHSLTHENIIVLFEPTPHLPRIGLFGLFLVARHKRDSSPASSTRC